VTRPTARWHGVTQTTQGTPADESGQSTMCYTGADVRKAIILVIALGLAGVGSAPLTACALFSSQLTDCATPKTESHCEQMEMAETAVSSVAQQDASCCTITQAPLPEAQSVASGVSLGAVTSLSLGFPGSLSPAQGAPRSEVVPDLSPPPLQSLLCTFLI
jgi:hypothetical protein